MKQTDFQVAIVLDGDGVGFWPNDTPSPLVGDEITASFNGQPIVGKVVKREWGVALRDEPSVQTAVLRIIVESPPAAPRGQATVQPLRL